VSTPAEAAAAIRAGGVVVIPTDTVYGLAADAGSAGARDALYALKGRDTGQPTALVAATVETLFELLPDADGRTHAAVTALLPGPYTLVVPNPGGRYPWLCGHDQAAIGVRVPRLDGPGAETLAAAGAVAATSANLPGGPEPRQLEDVPAELLGRVAAAVDGGTLPGVASTVLDLTGDLPAVLREGAGDVAAALARLAALD
jgi:tRNA threonylcarbamoyl adenosine modification protein (Sua5/YciO/YrdC/YwlC family)